MNVLLSPIRQLSATGRLALVLTLLLALQALIYGILVTSERAPEWADGRRPLEITAEEVQGLRVESMQGSSHTALELQRSSAGWKIGSLWDLPADTGLVRAFLDAMSELRVSEEVLVRRAVNHAPLGVADEEWEARVTVQLSGSSRTWYIGRGRGETIYLREQGSNDVHEAVGMPFAAFTTRLSSWTTFDPLSSGVVDNAAGLELVGDSRRVLRRQQQGWRAITRFGAFPLRQGVLEELTTSLKAIELRGVAHGTPLIEEEALRILVTTADGSSETLRWGDFDEETSTYAMTHSGQPWTLRVDGSAVAELLALSSQQLADFPEQRTSPEELLESLGFRDFPLLLPAPTRIPGLRDTRDVRDNNAIDVTDAPMPLPKPDPYEGALTPPSEL